MSQVFLSIIVPVYNDEKGIRKCIDSILAQEFSDYELFIVDDGSTDHSLEICDAYQKKDRRIHVFHKENGGVTSARKTGVKLAKGRYVTFVDADDWVEKDLYRRLCRIAKKNDSDILMAGYVEECMGGKKRKFESGSPGIYSGNKKREYLSKVNIIPSLWTKLFKIELIKSAMSVIDDRIRIGEDMVCTYFTLANANSIQICHIAGYHYNNKNRSRSGMGKKALLADYIRFCRNLDRVCKGRERWVYVRFQQIKRKQIFKIILK